MRRQMLVLGLIAGLLAGCGSDGGSGPSGGSEAPVIRGAQIVRVDARTFGARLDVFDAQGDVFGGLCRVSVRGVGALDIPINVLQPGANPADPEGDVVCAVRFLRPPPRGVTISGDMSVVDRAGHESNLVAFVVTFEAPGSPETGTGPLEFEGGTGERAR